MSRRPGGRGAVTSLRLLSHSFAPRVEWASCRKFHIVIFQRALCAIVLLSVIHLVSELKGSHTKVNESPSPRMHKLSEL